jgi:hypothetical protein
MSETSRSKFETAAPSKRGAALGDRPNGVATLEELGFEAQAPESYVEAAPKAGEAVGGFVPCRVYFRDSFRVAGISKASLDPERDKATYNAATGVIRAELGALKFELSIHGGWGPAVNVI